MADAEKRSVHTDALATLGTIINRNEKRDAIHLAVNPTLARVKLYPGQDVGVDGTQDNPVGIVDPFLKSPVPAGEWFWLVVYPRQITSLRHVWSHPAFPDTIQHSDSETWLRNFCASAGCPGYEAVMDLISKGETGSGYDHSYVDEEYLHFGGSDAHGSIPPEFWDHVEAVLGKKVEKRPTYFSCSC